MKAQMGWSVLETSHVNDHPVRANFGGLRHHLFDGAATPPCKGGEYVFAVVSKLAEMEARVLLPLGEGGSKGRMRMHFLPSPGASRHPLPKGESHPRNRFPNRESHETRISPASGTNRSSSFGQACCELSKRWR